MVSGKEQEEEQQEQKNGIVTAPLYYVRMSNNIS